MSLKDLNFKKRYSSSKDNLLRDFYTPALSEAVNYHRLSGFFSSAVLAIASRGISKFIYNNGHMKLVCGSKLRREDVEEIRKNSDNFDEIIEKNMLNELGNLEDIFIEEYIKALGWLVRKGRLEIKVAIVFDDKGIPMDYEKVNEKGLFHPKIGILEDSLGNKISFSGSINETAQGWLNNVEEIKVFRSWVDIENEYFLEDVDLFDDYWKGNAIDFKVFDLPVAIQKKLINSSPKDFEELKIEEIERKIVSIKKSKKRKIDLRDYQKEAIQYWMNNDKKGIFEMATGTGKTFTALGCLDRINYKLDKIVTIITTPYQHLIQQWKKEINKFGVHYDKTIIASSSKPKWKNILSDYLAQVYMGYIKRLIILTTHDTFSSLDFMKILKDNVNGFDVFLIADEMHGLGSKKRKQGLLEGYNIKLGLSATPKRWFDDIGTKKIYSYFDDVVFKFSLKNAILKINPETGKSYLTPFKYMPILTNLTDAELDDYFEKTKKIISRLNKTKDNVEKDEILELMLFQRADIIKNAENKYELLETLLKDQGQAIKWTIIYCSPQQIDNVMKIVSKFNIIAHRFTMKEGNIPVKEYNGLTEREHIIKNFADGKYQVLIAMKCLDEGIDIPPARNAVLMSNSGNPREYIQRIGRVLRRFTGKELAIIYDFLVVPSFKVLPSEFYQIERKIFEKELSRYIEIGSIAVNNAEALKTIYDMRKL
ncbi:MAG: DEAD/DEAH box helicase family protein [Actinobacteria bacterium]|nr:DEAD/DEAH box helicase family protein [Actinomycetota bacterium]